MIPRRSFKCNVMSVCGWVFSEMVMYANFSTILCELINMLQKIRMLVTLRFPGKNNENV